jgi:serine-type D-Ala-D-Ala endopeptidase (penicillin-binding protein 7)
MSESRFVEPTGLSPANVSTASDLARLVRAAHEYPLIREYSTKNRAAVQVSTGRRTRSLSYGNTNGLVRSKHWDIELSKTGYISEAGRCLVMLVRLAEKDLIVVLLDSWGKHSRVGDANRIKKWLETGATGRSS